VVQLAADGQSAESAQQALAAFCQAYWAPIYAFLRHRGRSSSDAQDLTQQFFVHLLEHNTLSRADREKGRLRTFLLGSLQNFLANEYDRAQALKRGGGRQILSLDENFAEAEASIRAADGMDGTNSFDLTWALNMVKRAWQQLQDAFAAEGKTQWLQEMRPFIAGGKWNAAPAGRSGGASGRSCCDATHFANAITSALPRGFAQRSSEHCFRSSRG